MGCGGSSEEPRRPRPQAADTGVTSRAQPGRPGVSQVVRPTGQNYHRREDQEAHQGTRKTSQNQAHSKSSSDQPGFKIPKKKKEQLIPDANVFANRDSWAKKVPNEHARSVADVARYLVHEAKSDLEKVRSFYKWMTLNICYDAESYVTKSHRYPSDPASVLRYRITVCDGYAQLFEALCKAAAIPCRYVAGFSKGTSYDPDVPITENSFVNHAWNIVCVNGEWWPVDVTWGAGYMDNRNKFVWHYNELNFLTDPDIFILAHFPYMNDDFEYSVRFQLLKKPITLEDFNLTVKPDRNGLEWGLELLSHTQCTIPVQGDVTIKFRTKYVKMTNISCNFNHKRTGEDFENNVILYQKEGVFTAKVKPPGEGLFKLMLFGETEGMKKHQGLVNYVIHCTEAADNAEPYPDHFGMWGPQQPKASECGFDEDINDLNVFLSDDGNLKFSIPLKESVDTIVRLEHSRKSADLDDYVSEASNDKVMVILARLPYTGYYKMQLFACDPDGGGNSYVPVSFFFIKCLKGLKGASPFNNKSDAQKFLKTESSKSQSKKKPKKPPTPPPTPPESDEDEDEEEEEEENEDKEEQKPVLSKSSPSAKQKTTSGNTEYNRQPAERDHQQNKIEDRNGDREKRTKEPSSAENNDDDSDTVVVEPLKMPRKQKVSTVSTQDDERKASFAKQDQQTRSKSPSGNNQHGLMYDQQGRLIYDQHGGIYDQQQLTTGQQSPANYGQSSTMMYDPYTGTMVPVVVQPNNIQPKTSDENEEDNDEEGDEDEDDEADEEEDPRQPVSVNHQKQHQYRDPPSVVTHIDDYPKQRDKSVVPAVAEPEEDEEEEDDDEDDEEDDEEEDDDKDEETEYTSQGRKENQNTDQHYQGHHPVNHGIPPHGSSNQELDDVEEEDENEEERKEDERSNERRVPHNPHQKVHRTSAVQQPKIQKREVDENDDDDGDEDDDEEEEEEDRQRRSSQYDQREYLAPYQSPYNHGGGHLAPSQSDPRMYGHSGVSNPYHQMGYLSPSASNGDFGVPPSSPNPYRGVVSPRTVHRPY